MNKHHLFLVSLIIVAGAAPSFAHEVHMSQTNLSHANVIHQDKVYERDLRDLADPDKVMTPRKALRWVRGLVGAGTGSPDANRVEFRPKLAINEANVRIIAAFAYKF